MTARLVEHFGAALPSDPACHCLPHAAAARGRAVRGVRRQGPHGVSQCLCAFAGDEHRREAAWTWKDCRTRGLTAGRPTQAALVALPGIGPYGVACLMLYLGKPGARQRRLGRPRRAVAGAWADPVTDKEVLAFFEAHGEWRGLVYKLLPLESGGAMRLGCSFAALPGPSERSSVLGSSPLYSCLALAIAGDGRTPLARRATARKVSPRRYLLFAAVHFLLLLQATPTPLSRFYPDLSAVHRGKCRIEAFPVFRDFCLGEGNSRSLTSSRRAWCRPMRYAAALIFFPASASSPPSAHLAADASHRSRAQSAG